MARRGWFGWKIYLTLPSPRKEWWYRPCFRCRCQEDGWMVSVARVLVFVVDGDGGCGALPKILVEMLEAKPEIRKRGKSDVTEFSG